MNPVQKKLIVPQANGKPGAVAVGQNRIQAAEQGSTEPAHTLTADTFFQVSDVTARILSMCTPHSARQFLMTNKVNYRQAYVHTSEIEPLFTAIQQSQTPREKLKLLSRLVLGTLPLCIKNQPKNIRQSFTERIFTLQSECTSEAIEDRTSHFELLLSLYCHMSPPFQSQIQQTWKILLSPPQILARPQAVSLLVKSLPVMDLEQRQQVLKQLEAEILRPRFPDRIHHQFHHIAPLTESPGSGTLVHQASPNIFRLGAT